MAFERLIDSLFTTPADRALATSFAAHWEGKPFADKIVTSLLTEAAAVNAKITAGELSSQAGMDYLVSFASEGAGLPADVVRDGQAWANDIAAQSGEPAAPEPRGLVEIIPPSPHANTIRRLFAPEERASVRSLVSFLEREPQLASRIEPLLHELSRSTDLSPERSYSYVADWMKATGWPSYLIDSTLDAIAGPAVAEHDAAVMAELTGDLSPRAQDGLRVADREKGLSEMARIEKLMKASQGTPEWREYWQNSATQDAYRAAVQASLGRAAVWHARRGARRRTSCARSAGARRAG